MQEARRQFCDKSVGNGHKSMSGTPQEAKMMVPESQHSTKGEPRTLNMFIKQTYF